MAFTALYSLSLNRFIAADEGFYLMAGKLVSTGKIPYQDFFYPQMPLLPYLHALWILILGAKWEIARGVTVLFSIGAITVTIWHIRVRSSLLMAVLAGLLIVSQPLFLTWFTVAKTYAFASLPLMLSVVLLIRALESPKETPWTFFFSGLCIGLAVNIRLFYAALIPVMLIYIVLNPEKRSRALLTFIAGGILTLIPHLYFWITDFQAYWFNNLGYHIVRSHRTPEIDLWSKQQVFLIATGLKQSARMDGWGFPLLFWLNILLFLGAVIQRQMPPLATSLGIVLFAFYFLPNPVHVQYFSSCIPLFVLGLASGMISWRKAPLVFGLCIMLSGIFLPSAIERMTRTGQGLKGIDRYTREIFTLPSMIEISTFLDSNFQPGDTVISQWPGYLFQTHIQPASGLENQFWVRMDGKLSEEARRHYHLMDTDDLKALPQERSLAGVIIEAQKFKRYTSKEVLQREGYQKIPAPPHMKAYRRK